MAFELRQDQRMTQSLVMTPKLQQAIKLLQLSRFELVETVAEEIQTNPALDCEEVDSMPASGSEPEPSPEPEATAGDKGEDFDWQSYVNEYNYSGPKIVNFNDNKEDDFIDTITDRSDGLKEHLLRQLHLSGLKPELMELGDFMIGNIDSYGYLRVVEKDSLCDAELEEKTLTEICDLTGALSADVSKVLGVIHRFDPSGVGARSTRESLLIQARMLPVRDTLVEAVISGYLPELANKNYKLIARRLGVGFDDIVSAAKKIIKGLNPMPGSAFGIEQSRTVTPDVFIRKIGGEYVITQNDSGLPRLKISPYYRNLMNSESELSEQAKQYIQERFRSALWLIKSIHQRHRTIYRVVESIVKFQRAFLDKGVEYLKPLTLKDVAEDLGVHESTVSRVTSNKYAETPRGTLRLKYFFSTSLEGSDGSDVSVEYIKGKMSELFDSENSKKPLSDMKMVEELGRFGIVLSRRTVTKYREAIGVLSSHKRKSYLDG